MNSEPTMDELIRAGKYAELGSLTELRFCKVCGQPLEPDAHGNRTMHAECYARKAAADMHRYYRRNAEKLRRQRKLKYARQKQARRTPPTAAAVTPDA